MQDTKYNFRLLKAVMIVSLLTFIPTIFKYMHWPAAGVLVFTFYMILFVMTFFVANQTINGFSKWGRLCWFAGWLFISLSFVGKIFRMMHWPGGTFYSVCGSMLAIISFCLISWSMKSWPKSVRWALAAWGIIPSIVFLVVNFMSARAFDAIENAWQPAIAWSDGSLHMREFYHWDGVLIWTHFIALALCSIAFLLVLRREKKQQKI